MSSINVMSTNNERSRKWDKVYYCPFCDIPQKKLPRHLSTKHSDELQVQDYLRETDEIKKTAKLCLLRNHGNHKHNCNVLRSGQGTLIVTYRPKGDVNPEDYGPCDKCFAYIARRDLWRHSCKMDPKSSEDRPPRKRRAISSKLLLPPPPGLTEEMNEMIARMRADDVTRVIKNDSLIKALGEKLYAKLGYDKHQENYMRCKLREIARLLINYRIDSNDENAKLEDCINPTKFRLLLTSVKNVAGFDNQKQNYSIPSLALKLGHSLRKCAKICEGQAIECGDVDKQKRAKEFTKLMDINWTEEMSTHALRTLSDAKRNRPRILPLADDVHVISDFLCRKGRQAATQLTAEAVSPDTRLQYWANLRDIVLTRLILFNRRRQGEVSYLKLEEYQKIEQGGKDGFIMNHLSPLEKQLCKYFSRVEVRGKRGKTVPLLMNLETKGWLDIVVSQRDVVGVAKENQYVFARNHYGSLDHVRGCDCLRTFSIECGAKQPELLRATKLRKQIATMSQILNLKDNELDLLARYLGHDIRVHREYYRLPEDTLQVAKVSKLLLAMERGGDGLQPGQGLDDITVLPDEGKEVKY